jgi:hypothetical protein
VSGIAICQTNQLITSPGNGATAELVIVANAQLAELGLSSNLTDTKRADEPIVSSLAADFKGRDYADYYEYGGGEFDLSCAEVVGRWLVGRSGLS